MTKLHPRPSDRDRCLKINEHVWARLGAEAGPRGLSRPQLANLGLSFLLDQPEIVDMLQASMIVEAEAERLELNSDERDAAELMIAVMRRAEKKNEKVTSLRIYNRIMQRKHREKIVAEKGG